MLVIAETGTLHFEAFLSRTTSLALDPSAMELDQTLKRIAFYAKGFAREIIPHSVYAARYRAFRRSIEAQPLDENILARVNYYNKLSQDKLYRIDNPNRPNVYDGSRYYYDLKECLNFFSPNFNIACIFRDLTTIPNQPTLVKSRPISGDNENSVLYKYIKLRNFRFFKDNYTWENKISKAVWRGGLNNRKWRKDLVIRHHNNQRCDIGHTKGQVDGIPPKSFVSPVEQLRYRYLVSVEGNDVATNLKWITASNSLCLMPAPRHETWFMEGRLRAGVHYVELRPDYEDLDEKMDYYDRHPDEARYIVSNANEHAKQFTDLRRERVISLLVLQKYFERTSQTPPWDIRVYKHPESSDERR